MNPACTSTLEAARGYVGRGLRVVPIPRGKKKAVIEKWPDLRLEMNDLPRHFSTNCNIAILLGEPSGHLVDVDLDCEEARALAPRYLPPTPAKTGRRSAREAHWWYRSPGVESKTFRDPSIGKMVVEIRSSGLMTVVGPSVHPSGERYEMLEGEPAAVGKEELGAAVAALHQAVLSARNRGARPELHLLPQTKGAAMKANGADSMAYVLRRAVAYLAAMPAAISGQGGHSRTYAAATALVHGFALDPEVALRLLTGHFNPRCQPPWTDKELRHKVDDAANKPHARPAGWLLHQEFPRGSTQPAASEALKSEGQIQRDGPDGQVFSPTELGNAERLVAKHGNDLRYCPEVRSWLIWDGRRWVRDSLNSVSHLAAMSNRSIREEAAKLSNQAERDVHMRWGAKVESRQRIEATVALAQNNPSITISAASLDSDRWKLNVLNGTIDLATGVLLPACRDDFITKLAPVQYDPRAECPLFMKFLERTFAGDSEVIRFMQKWFGHCLTGDISEQYLPILYGEGNNGKSVLVDTLMSIMGDYAGQTAPSLLVESTRREHPTEIADLQGRRLVVASETERGARLRLQLLKQITGDSRLKGRFMHQNFFCFDRTFKIVLVTNNPPRVEESTEAVRRRLRFVPFNVIVPPEERDPRLLERLKTEWPGILRFLVDGCLQWVAEGLNQPEAVTLASTSYLEQAHDVERFYAEKCVADAHSSTPWSVLRRAYEAWARENGEPVCSNAYLTLVFDRKHHPSKQVREGKMTCKHRVGVRLRDEEADSIADGTSSVVSAVSGVSGV